MNLMKKMSSFEPLDRGTVDALKVACVCTVLLIFLKMGFI